ncbi:type A2 lantipeptide [Nostoc sp. C052]|uniref:type A2 lanthipeptide n=1 Tax=Nostoc sp. C052 TaxID=2576902 RepID=UPI0015C376D6|nr:type A2 lanthipeptide [Nostoc sp. C052]QLE39978.1 type A2 lantipeptide [Nostoc sp. C052]
MATIKINNLNAAGSDLLNDSESYLNELTEQELENMLGGGGWSFKWAKTITGFPMCVSIIWYK